MPLDDSKGTPLSLMLDHHLPDAARFLVDYRDDSGDAYLVHKPWTPLQQHASGYVLNSERRHGAGNLKLHRPTCCSRRALKGGRSWTAPYIKVSLLEAQQALNWARQATGAAPASGPICRP